LVKYLLALIRYASYAATDDGETVKLRDFYSATSPTADSAAYALGTGG
jgi:hypothetical protein